nr:type II toxin-antitoxin system RelE/ParE family toxin [uncultured Lachnoanaerobaculum sp.]
MSMKKYKLSFLPLFEADLIEITDYISNNLNNPEVALRLVDDIEIEINRRLETPLAFAPYPISKNRPYPYYRINIRNFSVFYVVIDDTMEVRRVLYAKRNIDNLLR